MKKDTFIPCMGEEPIRDDAGRWRLSACRRRELCRRFSDHRADPDSDTERLRHSQPIDDGCDWFMPSEPSAPLSLDDYQRQAMTTCMPTCSNIPYMLFNLQGEVGELSSKIAKLIRKGKLYFTIGKFGADGMPREYIDRFSPSVQEVEYDAIKGELGDVLWQLSGLCSVLGLELSDVAQANLDKLASRQQRNVIDGEGDNR